MDMDFSFNSNRHPRKVRYAVFILVLALAVSLLSGCAQVQEEPTPTPTPTTSPTAPPETPAPTPELYVFPTDGPDYDPCGFFGENSVLGESIDVLIAGREEDKDYIANDQDDRIAHFFLVDDADYMGVESEPNYVITVDMDKDTRRVSSTGYMVRSTQDDIDRIIKRFLDVLEYDFGAPDTIDFVDVEESGQINGSISIRDFEFDIMLDSEMPGMYVFEYKHLSNLIVFAVEISESESQGEPEYTLLLKIY